MKNMVESGRYGSASEVFRDGLRLLEKSERGRLLEKALLGGLTPEEEALLPQDALCKMRDTVQAQIRLALEQSERGELIDGEAFFAQ